MTENQIEKIFEMLEKNIKLKAKLKNMSMSEVIREVDMTEGGFYRMLASGSMKVRTLIKISEVLNEPLTALLEGDSSISQTVTGNYNSTGINSNFSDNQNQYGNDSALKDEFIQSLKRQLEDKEKIIALLEKRE